MQAYNVTILHNPRDWVQININAKNMCPPVHHSKSPVPHTVETQYVLVLVH